MEWWHKAGILTGIATIASVMLAKKRRITKHIVCGPWASYEEAMSAHASLMGEYEAIAEEGNWELKEFTLPKLKVGPTGMKGGYAFTIKILGYPPSKYDAEGIELGHKDSRDIFDFLLRQGIPFRCERCHCFDEECILLLLPVDNAYNIFCEECESKIWNQMRAEGYEVSFNTLPGALDFFPTSTGRPPDNYLDVEKEYEAEEMGRTEVATALLHKAKNWPFIKSFDYENWTQSPEEMIQLGHPIKILNSWDDLEQSDIGNRYAWFYINFPLTVYRGSLKRPYPRQGRNRTGIDYEGYLEHEHITPSLSYTMGYTNVIPTSPYLLEALNYANIHNPQELEGGEPSELYSFDIQDYVVTFPRKSMPKTERGEDGRLYQVEGYENPVVMVAGGIWHEDTTLLWDTDEDSSWYGAEEEEEDTYARALAEMKKYIKMTLGVTLPGINPKQRDDARAFWEWFENKADTFHTTEVGDYECTYFAPEVKQCFYNAYMTLSEIEDAKYYEGWAVTLSGISIPIEHAWLVTKEGRVIDTTFALLEREYGHDKSEVVYMGVEIPYSYLLNAVVESGRAGPFLRNYWADDSDSGIEHEYRLYFAEHGQPPQDYHLHPKQRYPPPYNNPRRDRNPYEKDPYARKPEDWDWDSPQGRPWDPQNQKPKIKSKRHVRLINYPLFSAQKGRDLRKVEAQAKARRKQIRDYYEPYYPKMPKGYGEKDIGDYFSK